jgi:hypothetical protein
LAKGAKVGVFWLAGLLEFFIGAGEEEEVGEAEDLEETGC